jgi:hypothetical protein
MLKSIEPIMKKISVVLLLSFLFASAITAQGVKVISPAKYIAMSLFNFSKQVNWPISCQNGDFVVAIIGDKNVYQEFQTIAAGKTVGNQNIVVKFFKTPEEVAGFNHILYINDWYSSSLAKIIGKVGNQNTLIVGEKEGSVRSGAAISFVPSDGNMKFEMEKSNFEKYGLQVSSWLEKMSVKSGS